MNIENNISSHACNKHKWFRQFFFVKIVGALIHRYTQCRQSWEQRHSRRPINEKKQLQKQENVEKWQYIVTELFILWGYFKFILFVSNCDYKKIIRRLFVVFGCSPAAVFSLIVEAVESLYQLVLRSQFEIFLVQFQCGNCIFL